MEDEVTGGSSEVGDGSKDEDGVEETVGGSERGDGHTEIDSVGKDGEKEQLSTFKLFSVSFLTFSPNRSTIESIGSALEVSWGCVLEEF